MENDNKYKTKLKSNIIFGENELKAIIKSFDKTCYMPGIRRNPLELDSHDFCFLKSGNFKANLHVHTKNSDGLIEIRKLLNHASRIANRNAKSNTPFILAITDHDSLDGVKEALSLVKNNPEKYKNLKLVLGLEISTIGVSFKKQTEPVSIHLLAYGIDPYDKNLNNFLDMKINSKLTLANETIAELNKELSEELGFRFTIEEAAQIHDMIRKGQDEVSHPLEKYTAAKILHNYYLKNANFTYEKPSQKFKYIFKSNEPYYKLYKKALEKYLDYDLPQIPLNVEKLILKAIKIYKKSEPKMKNIQEAFSSFEETVKFISTLDYGIMSIAHPARIKAGNIETNLEDFYTNLFENYKVNGNDKACFYEGYYQSYDSETAFERLPFIDKSACKFKLIPSGGLDSHGPNAITRCPYA